MACVSAWAIPCLSGFDCACGQVSASANQVCFGQALWLATTAQGCVTSEAEMAQYLKVVVQRWRVFFGHFGQVIVAAKAYRFGSEGLCDELARLSFTKHPALQVQAVLGCW